ncbi:hypothetical protein LEMA_P031220.1 [Plenodomus lingam JN3]|uniref:Uncharacterized protein n=1 Tax=Leptosphaeria maculans (strain JN3 / isolate v23.1.3 / race Av1-4-5-6-7-8) TaxID=985895 RepID=E4ZWJ4_LEPMJ|nr:hypothetical protein LEMA_P031220.1 [Plenodomus lingam JN3]CBX95970.1 hypothetical protein LEMA_P031220.1 [Plenodomus lingam JN3]
MFSKRRRAASNPPQRAPPSASASLAATKAFVQHRESNTDLSSAAAAAALRTHVTTPTPVGHTVTKRMVRRGSVSSNGSNARPPPVGLHRQLSSGSMTERSFRAASPARSLPAEQHPPPVPPVPQSHLQQANAVHRRASSLEPTNRGGSPGPRGGGRGVSLDRAASNAAARGHERQTSHLAQVSEEEDAVRNSVNFSRPMSPGASAGRKPSPPKGQGWFGGPVVNKEAVQRMASTSRPQTSSGVSAYDLQNAQRSVQHAAERPVKTHQLAQGAEGTRLNSGSMRVKPTGAAVQSRSFLQAAARQPAGPVDPNSPDAVYDPSTRTFIRKQDAMAIHRELYEEPEQPSRQYVAQHVQDYHGQPLSPPQSGRGSPSPGQQYVRRVESPRPATAAKQAQPVVQPRTPEPPMEPVMQGRNSEDFADAEIQPSEEANVGRSLEQAVPMEPERTENIAVSNLRVNQDSSYPRLAAPGRSTPVNTETGLKRANTLSGPDRPVSLSPHRNAHFAPGVVELAGTKHEPLPRSISPAKSALKSSPSVSRRSHSPVASNGRLTSKSASSEASDATSDAESQKRKKSVRVSFEQTPVVVAVATGGDVESPPPHSGLGASKWSPVAEKDDEFEDFMKPRAPLPVFGSIREKERRPTSENLAEKVTETVTTTPLSASIGSIIENTTTSNDHALGNIVAQDFADQAKASSDPVPPQVTTVEGSGYVSDSSEESSALKHGDATEQSSVPEPKSLTSQYDRESSSPAPITEQVVEVPQLALQPATPSPYERPEPEFQAMTIPGGWDADGNEITPNASTPTDREGHSKRDEQPLPPKAQQITFAEDGETTEDDSSIYSDAYEDLTDTEGGFASIDALMQSPAGPSSSGLMSSKYADNVTESAAAKQTKDYDSDVDSDVTTTQDWGAAEKHWSSVSAAQRQTQGDKPVPDEGTRAEAAVNRVMQAPVVGQEPPTASIASDKNWTQLTAQASQVASKPLKSALKKTTVPQTIAAPEPKMRQSMRGPPPREGAPDVHMKKTMRGGGTDATPSMRASMRGSSDTSPRAQPQMRQSMRGSEPSPSPSASMGLAASRHSMVPLETKPPRAALQKKHIQTAPIVPKARRQSMPAVKQMPATVPTYDSDSDASASSFQRTRARGRNQPGRMTMRGSMRQEPAPTMRGAAPAPKQVHAISPPASPAQVIRKSMRSSSPASEPVKSSRFSIRSLSPMGRFRKGPEARPSSPTSSKPMPTFNKQPKPPKPQKQTAPIASRAKAFTSRFADSSDEEDDAHPRRFQSRFADSDDDEPIDYKLPPGLAPVRGIPRTREDDGESTELEEEAEESPTVASATAAKTEAATSGVNNGQANESSQRQGIALASGSLRDSKYAPGAPSSDAGTPTKQKRGFFGLGKKKQPLVSPADAAESTVRTADIPLAPSHRNREPGHVLTPINEDQDFDTLVASSPQSKKSPKLHRRSTPEWPLPSPPVIGDVERPMSSDGIATRRPRFASRQMSQVSNVTAPVVGAQGRSVSYGRTGKKKKFQGLRRVFGLND